MRWPGARWLEGSNPDLLLVCDHASAEVPEGLDLGVPPEVFEDHVAVDVGAGPLTEALARATGAAAQLGRWSRLVVDCNRPEGSPGLVVESSDGVLIPGNRGLTDAEYAARLSIHRDFHDRLTARIAARRPKLLVSVHSFTPLLASSPVPRPWPVAILWNQDERGAALALEALRADPRVPGPVGANEPYSGRILNYTMDRHAEATGIPYIGFEVRQDLIADREGQARWTGILADCLRHALKGLGR